ncbi:MAG: lytic transglycosylase domain-containing protein [Acidobacteriota bacterium]
MRFFSYYLVAAVAVLGGFFLGMRYQMLSDNVEEVRYLVRLHENRIQRLNEENAQLKETVDKLGTVVKLRKLLQDRRIRLTRGSVEDLAESIHLASQRYGLKPEMILAVIQTESSFIPDAISKKGAIGLMQLLPSTAREVADELNIEWTGTHLLKDPHTNIEFGAYYLSKLLQRFGDVDLALSAYNSGPNRVARFEDRETIPAEEYTELVLHTMETLF